MKNNYGTRSDGSFDFVYTDGEDGEDNGDKGGDDKGSKGSQTLVVEVGGENKNFTADDVKNLVSQQASATQKAQQVSTILKACDKFGLEPEVFVGQAEGAFSVISDLIEKGFVDKQGNIVEKKPGKPASDDINFSKAGDKNLAFPEDKVTALVSKALKPITDKLGAIEQDQTQLTRLRISDSIKGKFKNLEDTDISKLFAVAGNDRSKTLVQHAEEMAKEKVKAHSALRKDFAKEFGVDVDKFDANKLREQGADGSAGGLFEGKKFSFKKGKDAISPRQAMHEFLNPDG